MNNNNKLKVFSGRANIPLAEKIAQCLGDTLGKITLSTTSPTAKSRSASRRTCAAGMSSSSSRPARRSTKT